MGGIKTVPKKTRMAAIVKAMPDKGSFDKELLENTIKNTRVGERGINSEQSVREYIGLLLDAGMIIRRDERYRVTIEAVTPGKILVTTPSELQTPLIIDLITRALNGTEGVTIKEVI